MQQVPAGELLAHFPDDPYLRLSVTPDLATPAWRTDDSFVVERTASHGRKDLTAIGTVAGVSHLVTRLLAEGAVPDAGSVTFSFAARASLAPLLGDTGGDWDWMWTASAPPALPGEERLEILDDSADAAELIELTSRANPDSHGRPGEGRADYWGGIRSDSGELVAMGGVVRTAGGYGMLAGIGVDPTVRGQGLGAAITTGLTRRELGRGGQAGPGCTLGVFIDNDHAIGLYRRLGYRLGHRFASRQLHAPSVSCC